jgi:hypothetical protein
MIYAERSLGNVGVCVRVIVHMSKKERERNN